MPPSSTRKEQGVKKRVKKACDRCRLKKNKCDGAPLCSRCKTDNAICSFSESRHVHHKAYSGEYVELMERQKRSLVTALQLLYRRLLENSAWKGPLLVEFDGQPLTHEILKSLEIPTSSFDSFVRRNSKDEERVSSRSERPGHCDYILNNDGIESPSPEESCRRSPSYTFGSDGDLLPVQETQSASSAWRGVSSPATGIVQDQSHSCWQPEAQFATNIWGPASPPNPHMAQCQSTLYRPPLVSAESFLPTQDFILLPVQGFIRSNHPQVYDWASPCAQLDGVQSDDALALDPWELQADYFLYQL